MNASLCVVLPFDSSSSSGQAGSEPAPYPIQRIDTIGGRTEKGKKPFVLSLPVLSTSTGSVQALSKGRSTNRLSNRFMR